MRKKLKNLDMWWGNKVMHFERQGANKNCQTHFAGYKNSVSSICGLSPWAPVRKNELRQQCRSSFFCPAYRRKRSPEAYGPGTSAIQRIGTEQGKAVQA